MRLFTSEESFALYEDGFGDADVFGRKASGIALSELVEKIDEPLVIAVDGPWGCGKSWFLRRWVGAHTIENGGTALVVYFDAFSHDFNNEPLLALIGEVEKRHPKDSNQEVLSGIKNAAFKISRPAFRIALAVASAGLSEIASTVVDAGIDAAKTELESAADNFWRKESERAAAMDVFRDQLKLLTYDEGGQPRKVIFVIDELDRCRPDYALQILETTKHFFSIPGVHFVLGTSLRDLENSVISRYGIKTDAYRYLKKFYSLSIHLKEKSEVGERRVVIADFSRSKAIDFGLGQHTAQDLAAQIALASRANLVSLRDCNSVIARLVLVPKSKELDKYTFGFRNTLIGMSIIRSIEPKLYHSVKAGACSFEDIVNFFAIKQSELDHTKPGSFNQDAYRLYVMWGYLLDPGRLAAESMQRAESMFGQFGIDSQKGLFQEIDEKHLSVFSI